MAAHVLYCIYKYTFQRNKNGEWLEARVDHQQAIFKFSKMVCAGQTPFYKRSKTQFFIFVKIKIATGSHFQS